MNDMVNHIFKNLDAHRSNIIKLNKQMTWQNRINTCYVIHMILTLWMELDLNKRNAELQKEIDILKQHIKENEGE